MYPLMNSTCRSMYFCHYKNDDFAFVIRLNYDSAEYTKHSVCLCLFMGKTSSYMLTDKFFCS
jgi:hypothetical protein